ncbi:MAG: ferric reductase-like transmembrane domain-containing protein [Candidatus Dojkabacteria bacterium]
MKLFDRPTLLVFIVAAFSIILWVMDEGQFTTANIPTYIGAIAGILAITLMSFEFISSTRLKIFEKFSGGLDVVYRFHSYIGKLGAMIILAHPTLLMLQKFAGIDTIKRYFLPGSIEFFSWGIYAFWLLLLLVILTLFVKMSYRWWKFTHLLMVVVYLFASYHVFLDYTNSQRSPGISFREGWMLTIILIGIISLLYKELVYPFLAKKFKVVKVNPIGLVTEVYMEPEKGKLNFIPGQYIFMSVMDSKELPNEAHPFGITSSVNDNNIRVSIKALGDYTKRAGLIKPGNTVHIWGPHGDFNWDSVSKYKKQVWIAGGIGVAPFLSMLKYAIETKSEKEISLFYVEKNESECEYNTELDELTKGSKVKLYHHYDVRDGFITAKYIEKKVGSLNDAAIMICGPVGMAKALLKQFRGMGLKEDQIREEGFGMRL